jgi:hypothetical protein
MLALGGCISNDFDEAQFRCEPGGAGEQCPPPMGCGVDGLCRSKPCLQGFSDCDGDAGNGCETEVAVSGEHCGACARSCRGGPCSGGVCQPLAIAEAQTSPQLIVARGGKVHWTNKDVATIHSVSTQGGEIISHPTALGGTIAGLAVDDRYLYFTAKEAGTVGRIPISGGAPFHIATGQSKPFGIALEDTYVYWTNLGDADAPTPVAGSVMRATFAGADRYTLAGGQDDAYGVSVDGERAYWTIHRAAGSVHSAQLPRGAPEPLASMQYFPWSIVATGERVYWRADTKVVSSVPGGTPETFVAEDVKVYGLAVDDDDVYWTTVSSVRKAPRRPDRGGSTAVLASDQPLPQGLAIDDVYVYWTNSDGGTVMRLVKSP